MTEEKVLINRLNMLRGLFAILIVIGHTSMFYEDELIVLGTIHKLNMVSVGFFLYTSGISMAYNYDMKRDYLKGFFRRKCIFLFLVACLAQLMDQVLQHIIFDIDYTFNSKFFFSINWYVYEIIALYTVFYLLYKAVKNTIIRELLLLAISTGLGMLTLYLLKHGSWSVWNKSFYFSILSFPLGVIVHNHYEKLERLVRKHRSISVVTLIAAVMASSASVLMNPETILGGILLRNAFGAGLLLILSIALLYIAIEGNESFSKILKVTSDYSLEVYLYHFIALSFIARIFDDRWTYDIRYTLAVLAATAILALGMHKIDRIIAKIINGVDKHYEKN